MYAVFHLLIVFFCLRYLHSPSHIILNEYYKLWHHIKQCSCLNCMTLYARLNRVEHVISIIILRHIVWLMTGAVIAVLTKIACDVKDLIVVCLGWYSVRV